MNEYTALALWSTVPALMIATTCVLAAQQKQAREAQKAHERYSRQLDKWLKFTASIQPKTDA